MPVTIGDCPRLCCSVIIPPVGVFFQTGCDYHLAICILLTLLGYIPGDAAIWTLDYNDFSRFYDEGDVCMAVPTIFTVFPGKNLTENYCLVFFFVVACEGAILNGIFIVRFCQISYSMTVTYSLDVASSTFFGIHKLLFRWKGSIWKSIWRELLLWIVAYAALSILYRFILSKENQRTFEDLVIFFYTYGDYIPLTFMLGFYVSTVFARWNSILDNLGWIDSPGLLVAIHIKGHSGTARNIRRNIMRYMVLVQAMVFRDISTSVKQRFPTMDHLVTAGLMTKNELKEFDAIISPQLKYWVPMNWIFLLIRKAKDMNLIDSDIIYTDLLDKIQQYRVNVLTLTMYDWVSVPLVYTQVVNLAVRTYFIVALLGRQYLVNDRDIVTSKTIDLYVPIMTILQFLFFVGWMKVAEALLNPLGCDDDDFECNWVIDRNLQVGLAMVDDACGKVPKLEKDIFWNDVLPEPLYTQESANRHHNPMIGSCNDLSTEDAVFLQPPKHRIMSSETVNSSDLPQIRNTEEVLVKIHNPEKKSVSDYSDSRRSSISQKDKNKFFASLKRKINRGQKTSVVGDYPLGDIYAEWGQEGDSSNEISRRDITKQDSESRRNYPHSRENSVCSSNFVDGIQTPVTQPFSSQIHGNQKASNSINPGILNRLLEEISRNNESNQDIQKVNSSTLTVNEMLPVIEEEDHEKFKKPTVIDEEKRSKKVKGLQKEEENQEEPFSPFKASTDSLEKLKQILKSADSDSPYSSSNAVVSEDNGSENLSFLNFTNHEDDRISDSSSEITKVVSKKRRVTL